MKLIAKIRNKFRNYRLETFTKSNKKSYLVTIPSFMKKKVIMSKVGEKEETQHINFEEIEKNYGFKREYHTPESWLTFQEAELSRSVDPL